MNELELIEFLINGGATMVMFWLFWQERKRSMELSDRMTKLQTDCYQSILDVMRGKPNIPPIIADQ
jgi:hypothetical protein